jgi:histidyl-tRNA synthetase
MKIQRLRGMHDIFGDDALKFQRMEAAARSVFSRFGFEELRTPLLEEKELFSRALGTDTDVVQKEMYEFTDRSKTQVAMRPEGTAGVVRAYLENEFDKKEGLCKFYYIGAMFRSERPQAGRLRQFHQIGVEQLGTDSPYADAECIHALTVFLDEAGASGYKVKLNNLGTMEERKDFREALAAYFAPHRAALCEDCRERLTRNVFRLLDCKVESCRAIVKDSPPITLYLMPASKSHFEKVRASLKSLGVPFEEDPFMVRGLDYYTMTVFELSHPKLGAQDALAAGGRYDRLISAFGGDEAGAVGFALGMERLALCMKEPEHPPLENGVFVVSLGEEAFQEAFRLVASLRAHGVQASMDLSPKSMKSQMRLADKTKSAFTLILGENELKSGQWTVKNMKVGSQETIDGKDCVNLLRKRLVRSHS